MLSTVPRIGKFSITSKSSKFGLQYHSIMSSENGKMEKNTITPNSEPFSSSSNHNKFGPFPISGVVAIVKPTGPTSMSILDQLKPLLKQSKVFQQANDVDKKQDRRNRKFRKFNKEMGAFIAPKLGQGGTLDPLADGVLVIGIGAGTKKLQDYIQCTKQYKTTALLGSSTLSYDCKDPILERKPFQHVQPDGIKELLKKDFTGDHWQAPPLYSAIRIGGKRLFEYARSGDALPAPIEPRKVRIEKISLTEWLQSDQHSFKEPEKECSEEERKVALAARKLIVGNSAEEQEKDDENIDNKSTIQSSNTKPPAFTLDMTVSSGTYVRSIVHDLASKLDSAAHVVRLTRIRQGDWILPGYKGEADEKQNLNEAIEWSVFEKAISEMSKDGDSMEDGGAAKKRKLSDGESQEVQNQNERESVNEDNHQLKEWEKVVMERMQRC